MSMQDRRVHQLFTVSVVLKGAHAAIECAGGIALAVISSPTIVNVVRTLTQEELVEDPHDFVATHLLAAVQDFSVGTRHFYALYLLTHGVVKLFLVAGLLREKLWSYPTSLVVLGVFVAYQLYRFSYTHGTGLMALTLFDVVVIGLVWHEYRVVRRSLVN